MASRLPAGFYHWCLVLAFAATLRIRVRAGDVSSFLVVELMTYPVAACLLMELLVRHRLMDELRRVYRRNRPLAWYVGYAAFASVLGLARSADALHAFKELFPAIALYALVVMTVDSYGRIIGLLVANLAGAMVTVLLCVLQAATGGPYLVSQSEHIDKKLDLAGDHMAQIPTGLFGHPNAVALVLLPVAVFLVIATWPGLVPGRRLRLAMLGLLASTMFVLVGTYAKGALVWLAAGVGLLLLPRWFDRHRLALSVATVVLGIIALTVLSVAYFEEGDPRAGSFVSRIELWRAAIMVIAADKSVAFLGNGHGGALMEEISLVDFPNAHNAWLNQVLTFGLPALAFYLAAFFVALRSLARVVRAALHPVRSLSLAAMASLTALWGEYFLEPSDGGVIFPCQLFTLFALAAIVRPGLMPDGPQGDEVDDASRRK